MTSEGRKQGQFSLSKETLRQPVGIVTARWNEKVTESLRDGALNKLHQFQIPSESIYDHSVPGSFELPLGAQFLAENTRVGGIVAIGCLIQGETPHFDYIAQTVTQHLSQLNLHYHLPISFGVLTVNDQSQAEARAGGESGNKGDEAAEAMLEMMEFRQSLRIKKQQPGF